ncbi:13883_t:CDS:2, partial [Cetraspora pellucida]
QINQYLASSTQQTNTYLQTLSMGTTTGTGDQNATPLRGLTVQLLVFSSRDGENVLTWLLQVDLLFKARKVDDDERLQYVIIRLQDAALQWYLNQVQADESYQPFANLKQTTTVQEYVSRFRNILGQIDGMHKADKVMYFTEGLKGATKAEVNYHTPENLDDAIKLAASYNSAIKHGGSYSSQSKGQAPTSMELDRVESGNPIKFRPIKEKNKGSKTIENAEPKVAETTNVEKNEEHKRLNRESLLKVKGEIQGKRALILIDCGASKDFINLNFVEKLQLEMDEKEVDNTTVELADGSLHTLAEASEQNDTKACQSILVTRNQFVKNTKSTAELYAILLSNITNKKPVIDQIPEFLKDL